MIKHSLSIPALKDGAFRVLGKTLGCYCAPKACHGDLLVELAQAARVKVALNTMLHRSFQSYVAQRASVNPLPAQEATLFDFLTLPPSESPPIFKISFHFFEVANVCPCVKTLDAVCSLWSDSKYVCWAQPNVTTRMFFCVPITALRQSYGKP